MYTNIIVIDLFYIALFSALEQTHCALVACGSEGVTVSYYSAFINVHRSGVLTGLYQNHRLRHSDLTPSLPWCHLKTTNKNAKFETLDCFCLIFRPGI